MTDWRRDIEDLYSDDEARTILERGLAEAALTKRLETAQARTEREEFIATAGPWKGRHLSLRKIFWLIFGAWAVIGIGIELIK